jgi:integrase
MPTSQRHLSPATKPPIKNLSEFDLHTLISGTTNSDHKALLAFIADTGLRIAELCGLTIADVTWNGNPSQSLELRPEIAKNHKPRTIPLSERARAAIAQMLYATHPLFTTGPNHHKMTPRTAQRICQKWGRKILQRNLTPHVLRHTFATRLMKRTDIRTVQTLLGHSSLSSTQIYTHPTSDDLSQAIHALDQQETSPIASGK